MPRPRRSFRFLIRRQSQMRSSLTLIVAVASCLIVGVPSAVTAQTCNNIPSGGGQSIEGFVKLADGTCTVAQDTYVVRLKTYRLDSLATANGSCTLRNMVCSPLPCECQETGTEQRGVGSTRIQQTAGGPNPPYNVGPLYALPMSSFPHVADSRVAGATSPEGRNWMPGWAGETTIEFATIANSTNCTMSPTVWPTNFNVVVVNCAPRFLTPGTGGTVPRHLPNGPIEVYYSGAGAQVIAAMEAARADWNLVQGSVTFIPATGPCQPNNPSCISVTQSGSNLCAITPLQPADADGVFNNSSTVYFPTAASAWNANALRRFANHELGHLLGLDDNNNTCTKASGIMGPMNCTDWFGFAYTPQATEQLPVNRSVYGPHSTTSCPVAPWP